MTSNTFSGKTAIVADRHLHMRGWLREQLGRTDLIEHLREYPSAEENLEELGTLFDALEIGWQDSYARRCRELLVRVFDELPRDKRVVAAHITYNKLAAKYGVQSHKPTGKH